MEDAELDQQSRKLAEAMESFLDDAVDETDAEFDKLLGAENDPAELKRLMNQLANGSEDQIEDAARCLQFMEPTGGELESQIRQQLNSMLGAQGSTYHLAVIKALGTWGNQESERLLCELLEIPGPQKQVQYAFESLAACNTSTSAKVVARHLSGANKAQAIRVLRRMDHQHVEDALLAAMREHGSGLDETVITLLGQVGTSKSLPVLLDASKSGNRNLSQAAARASKRIQMR